MYYNKEEIAKLINNEDSARCLDGSDYERGELESMQESINKNSRAIQHILDLLITKSLISKEDAVNVLFKAQL